MKAMQGGVGLGGGGEEDGGEVLFVWWRGRRGSGGRGWSGQRCGGRSGRGQDIRAGRGSSSSIVRVEVYRVGPTDARLGMRNVVQVTLNNHKRYGC